MNYITPEQFESLPQNVQDALFDWWKWQIGDLYYNYNPYAEKFDIIRYELDDLKIKRKVYYDYDPFRPIPHIKRFIRIPLLQMHQLWDYIEETTGGRIDIVHAVHARVITIYDNTNYSCLHQSFIEFDKNILEALLQVAIVITPKE